MPASNCKTPPLRHHGRRVLLHRAWPALRLVAILGVAMISTRVARAQSSPTSRRAAAEAPTSAEIFGGIELTPAQRSQLAALTTETRARMQAITSRQVQGAPMASADRAELVRLMDAHRARLRDLLTPAQRDRYDLNERGWRARRAEVLRQRGDSALTPAGRKS